MKSVALSALIGALLATSLVRTQAQATNVIVSVTINLSGMAGAGNNTAERVRITTRDVINAVGAATGNTFSTRAKLLGVFPDSGAPHFLVRDGTNDVAVTGLAVSKPHYVDVTRTNSVGTMTGSTAAILNFVFDAGGGHQPTFNVQGYTTVSLNNRGSGHALLSENAPVSFRSNVNGFGRDLNGHDAVLQGSISAGGRKIEIF